MKAGWEVKTLGDMCDVITKGTTPTSIGYKFSTEGINFVKVESITENGLFIRNKMANITEDCHNVLKRSQLQEGDILFSIAGALGRTAFVTKEILPANTNQALAIIRLKKSSDILPKFILKALETGITLEQIEKFKGGVAQQNLSLSQIKEFYIPIPPVPEQQRIVSLLDKAFASIATAKANTEQNLKNARALFDSYLHEVFSQRGEGWEEKTLNEVCTIEKSQGNYKNLPYVGLEHIESNTGRFIGSVQPMTVKSSTFKFSNEHILYGRLRPYLNKVIIPDFIGHCSTEIFPIKPCLKLSKEFLFYWFISNETVNKINATCTGARMPRANMNDVLNFEFPLAPIHEQEIIVSNLDALKKETQRLETLYQGVNPTSALSGAI